MDDLPTCKCMTPPLSYLDFEDAPGVPSFRDDKWGGEVSVERCKHCGTHWLQYFIEYPAFTSSGRWCRAPVTEDDLRELTSDAVLGFVAHRPRYLYGGSYFNSTGKVGTTAFDPELWVRT